MNEIKNAVIESAVITNEDHGCLSAWIHLDYGGSGQGFGGHALYLPGDYKHSNNQKNYAGHFIYRVMQIAGVGKWEHLRGKTIRVKASHNGVSEIGHIVKDDWFCPRNDFDEMERSTPSSPKSHEEGK